MTSDNQSTAKPGSGVIPTIKPNEEVLNTPSAGTDCSTKLCDLDATTPHPSFANEKAAKEAIAMSIVLHMALRKEQAQCESLRQELANSEEARLHFTRLYETAAKVMEKQQQELSLIRHAILLHRNATPDWTPKAIAIYLEKISSIDPDEVDRQRAEISGLKQELAQAKEELAQMREEIDRLQYDLNEYKSLADHHFKERINAVNSLTQERSARSALEGKFEDHCASEAMLCARYEQRIKEAEGKLGEMREALKFALKWFSHPQEDSLHEWERIAEWFHSDTGILRPGKDQVLRCHSDEERSEAWNTWCTSNALKARKCLTAALSKCEKTPSAIAAGNSPTLGAALEPIKKEECKP